MHCRHKGTAVFSDTKVFAMILYNKNGGQSYLWQKKKRPTTGKTWNRNYLQISCILDRTKWIHKLRKSTSWSAENSKIQKKIQCSNEAFIPSSVMLLSTVSIEMQFSPVSFHWPPNILLKYPHYNKHHHVNSYCLSAQNSQSRATAVMKQTYNINIGLRNKLN